MEPFAARYRLLDPSSGAATEEAECAMAIEDDAVTLQPKASAPLRIAYVDLARLEPKELAIGFTLAGGDRIEIGALGKRLDEALRTIRIRRRDHLLKALLLAELSGGDLEEGAFERRDRGGAILGAGTCALSVQRTSLAVVPDAEPPFLLYYGEVASVSFDEARYAIVMSLADGGTFDLLRLGPRTDVLRRGIERKMTDLRSRTAQAVYALAPELSMLHLRRLASVLRDGVVASRDQVEKAASGAWEALWRRGMHQDEARRACADHLGSRASAQFVILKEIEEPAEEGDDEGATGDAPLPGLGDRRLIYFFAIGGALVMETPGREDSATYVFRAGEDPARRAQEIGRSLAAVQFRREPVHLPEAALDTGAYVRYRAAARLLPELKAARAAFLGRAIHKSVDAWRRELDEAIGRA